MAAAPSLSDEIQRGLIDPGGEGLSKSKLARSALNTAWGNFVATTTSPDVSVVERDRLLYQILYHVIDILQGHDLETQRAESQSSEKQAEQDRSISHVLSIAKSRTDFDKSVIESKSGSSLKVFTGKENFREWITKIVNAFSVTHTDSRLLFMHLERAVNESNKEPDEDRINQIYVELGWSASKINSFNEDLYHVMVDKTSGAALDKVHGVTPGHGVTAFVRFSLGLVAAPDWQFKRDSEGS